MLLDAGYDQNKYTPKYSTEDLDNKSVLIKGAFSQEITDSLGIKLSAGTSASEKFNTELQINWKIVNGIAIYVKGGYSQIDYKQNGLTDQYGNVWTGGIGLQWTFGGVAAKSAALREDAGKLDGNPTAERKPEKIVPARLLQDVAQNPAIRSTRVNAVVDQSTTRLVAINKTGLPSGTTIDQQTGDISVVAAAGAITGITKNATTFANAGQFGLSGTNFTIYTTKIAEPAVGVTDTYIITTSAPQTITVVVQHGSVKIVSVTVSSSPASDTTAPVANADSTTTPYNTAKNNIDVLANDTDNS